MSIEDPYFVVRDEISASVHSCEAKLAEWRALMETQNGAKARELTSELRSNVRSAEWDLEDLEESVSVVRNNPARFGLHIGELDARVAYIRETRLKLADFKNEIEGPHVNEKLLAMDSMPAKKPSSYQPNRFNKREAYDNPGYGRYSQQQQQLLHQQDQGLEQIGKNVGQLKQISRAIGNELDDQAVLIDSLSAEVDATSGRMSATIAKIQRFSRLSTDRRQWYAIGGLAVLIFILILLLFS